MKYHSLIRKIDWYIVFIVLIGLTVLVLKCLIVRPIQYVGHADASGYAEMADSIVHGRGLAVDYISFYFLKYSQIVRPEDHWPPLYSFFIAPFFLIMGKTAYAAKLPSIIISSLLFPIVGYMLGRSFSRSKVVGLATALHILVYPAFFTHSLYCLSDVIFAFMVFATVLFAVKGMDDGRYFYPMGVLMALAYYAKGAGLVLIPAYVLFYLICRPSIKELIHDKKFLGGLGIAFLVLLPWFIRNTIHFHNPIFSTQQFAAGYIGYESWEVGTYNLYWGEKLPSFFTKLKRGVGFVAKMTGDYFKQYLWWTFIDISKSTGKFQASDFHTYIMGISSAIGLVALLIANAYTFLGKIVKRVTPSVSEFTPIKMIHKFFSILLSPWRNKLLHIVWLVILFLLLFLSLCWSPINRLSFPASALIIVTGWTVCYAILKSLLNWNRYSKYIIAVILVGMMIPTVWHSSATIYQTWKTSGYPYREGGQDWMEAGRWLKANAPGSVTMTRNPWELHFYSEEKAIQIPLAELDKIIEVGRFYGATHLIPYDGRPTLKPWIEGEVPGLELVYDKGLQIYKIHYDLLVEGQRG